MPSYGMWYTTDQAKWQRSIATQSRKIGKRRPVETAWRLYDPGSALTENHSPPSGTSRPSPTLPACVAKVLCARRYEAMISAGSVREDRSLSRRRGLGVRTATEGAHILLPLRSSRRCEPIHGAKSKITASAAKARESSPPCRTPREPSGAPGRSLAPPPWTCE